MLQRAYQTSKNAPSEPHSLAAASSGGKFVASRTAGLYSARVRDPKSENLDKFRMNYLSVLQRVLEPVPIRGKGRIAELILSHMNGEVDCHPLPGVTVSLRTNQRIERWMWAGAYEPELVSLLKRTLKPGMTVLDLGANIGYFSVIAAALVSDDG